MKLDSSTLPSNGLYTAAHFIDVLPITYLKLNEYEDEPANTEVQKLLRDIKYFIAPIPDWRNLLLFDLDALILTAKYISVTTKPEMKIYAKCPVHGDYEVDLDISKVKFSSLKSEDLKIKTINLHGNEFNFNLTTTIGAFYDLLVELNKWELKLSRSDLMLMAVISTENTRNQAYEAITGAVGDDIALIHYLTNGRILSDATVKYKCPTCGKEVVMGINNLITKIFRIIHLNSDLSQKITYYK